MPRMFNLTPYVDNRSLIQGQFIQLRRIRYEDGYALVLAELNQLLFRQMHDVVHFLRRPLEVRDREGKYGDTLDTHPETYLEGLPCI